MKIDPNQMEIIANQLRCPRGKAGLEMAEQMNESNYGMTLNTIQNLKLKAKNVILEIGHGNAKHLPEILEAAPDLKYLGIEISTAMKNEAERLNSTFVKNKKAQFFHYSGDLLPFKNNSVHKVMTVNTLYFWKNPVTTIQEIYRVLKRGGLFNIAYCHKDFMKNLPFTAYGFQLYSDEDVLYLLANTEFKIVKLTHHEETVKSKHGEMVNRPYSILSSKK